MLKELIAQADNAAARVQDQGVRADLDLNARSIAAIAHSLRPWRWIAAANPPKAYPKPRRLARHFCLLQIPGK